MSEIIYTYPIDNPDKIEPMEREKFYAEQTQLELPTRYAGVIHGILINTKGEMLLQKRAENKGHNPGMWDKSFGGHIRYGSDTLRTIEEEVLQELGILTFNSKDEMEFIDRIKTSKNYLQRIAIMKHSGQYLSLDIRIMGGKKVTIGNKTNFFIGVSDSTPEPLDGEVQTTQYITLENLDREFQKDSEQVIYTNDLRSIILNQRWNILGVLDMLSALK